MIIYYESKTGNVQRFVERLKQKKDWEFVKLNNDTIPKEDGHLLTYTTNFGDVPEVTENFLERANDLHIKILSVASSGNMNWGKLFALAADKISEEYEIIKMYKFELSGTQKNIDEYINMVEENNEKE